MGYASSSFWMISWIFSSFSNEAPLTSWVKLFMARLSRFKAFREWVVFKFRSLEGTHSSKSFGVQLNIRQSFSMDASEKLFKRPVEMRVAVAVEKPWFTKNVKGRSMFLIWHTRRILIFSIKIKLCYSDITPHVW